MIRICIGLYRARRWKLAEEVVLFRWGIGLLKYILIRIGLNLVVKFKFKLLFSNSFLECHFLQ